MKYTLSLVALLLLLLLVVVVVVVVFVNSSLFDALRYMHLQHINELASG